MIDRELEYIGVAHFSAMARKKNSSASVLNRTRIAGLVGGRSPSELAGPGFDLLNSRFNLLLYTDSVDLIQFQIEL